MRYIPFGKTGLTVSEIGLGCLPLQRVSKEDAAGIIRCAVDGGVTYFDTAHNYTDSEEKVGYALEGVRERVVIATKSSAKTYDGVLADITESLRRLKTDYVDIFQFHNPSVKPDPEAEQGIYAAALEAKERGYVRHIGITTHRTDFAKEFLASGYYETLMTPFSYISCEEELEIASLAAEAEVGFVAMKMLCGGLLTNAENCDAFRRLYPNVLPIWGVQKMEEMREWIELANRDNPMTDEIRARITEDQKLLAGDFCRGCGYCMPCSAGIDIPTCARMSLLLRRSPYQGFLTKSGFEKMQRIKECIDCGLCMSRCPYGLSTPTLLRENLADYEAFYAEHADEATG